MGITSLKLTATGTGWKKAIHPQTVPPSTGVQFTAPIADWAVVFGYQNSSGPYYLVGFEANVPFAARWDGSALTTLAKGEAVAGGTYRFHIFMREQLVGSSVSENFWHSFGIFMNDSPVLAYSHYATQLPAENYLGMALKADTTSEVTFFGWRVPELTEYPEWLAIDPGETVMGSMARVLEGRYLRFFLRGTGVLRAWVPKPTTEVLSLTDAQIFSRQTATNAGEFVTHLRMHGAYVMAEYVDWELVQKYGHRFAEDNNPYLMSAWECLEFAKLRMRLMREESIQEQISTLARFLLEPEDHIVVAGEHRIISARSLRGQIGSVLDTLVLRNYSWSS